MACFAAVIDAKCEKGTKWELSGKETFVKVELVGIDVPTQRMRTAPCKCGDTGVAVGQTLQLDVQPESTELQLKLCHTKASKSGSVVTNLCGGGIFVADMIEAGKCDKWFKLFSPGTAVTPQVWGKVHLSITFIPGVSSSAEGRAAAGGGAGGAAAVAASSGRKKAGGKLKMLLGAAVTAVAAVFVRRWVDDYFWEYVDAEDEPETKKR